MTYLGESLVPKRCLSTVVMFATFFNQCDRSVCLLRNKISLKFPDLLIVLFSEDPRSSFKLLNMKESFRQSLFLPLRSVAFYFLT